MDKKELEELRKLSPQQRIERLRQLEEQKKKEIEETTKLLKESQEELARATRLEGIEVPEARQIDVTKLFTPKEQDLLEEVLEREARERPLTKLEPQKAEYIINLSKEPTDEIYNRMRSIYSEVRTAGYISPSQHEEIAVIDNAMQQKAIDIKSGNYLPSQDVSRKVVVSIELAEKMKDLYRG